MWKKRFNAAAYQTGSLTEPRIDGYSIYWMREDHSMYSPPILLRRGRNTSGSGEAIQRLNTIQGVRMAHANGDRREQIKDIVSISARLATVEDRAVPGHWEGDLLFEKQPYRDHERHRLSQGPKRWQTERRAAADA
jgi:IS30 family transposase